MARKHLNLNQHCAYVNCHSKKFIPAEKRSNGGALCEYHERQLAASVARMVDSWRKRVPRRRTPLDELMKRVEI
jgi:hypothetical protein